MLQEGEPSESESLDELSTGHFHMPYDIVREGKCCDRLIKSTFVCLGTWLMNGIEATRSHFIAFFSKSRCTNRKRTRRLAVILVLWGTRGSCLHWGEAGEQVIEI